MIKDNSPTSYRFYYFSNTQLTSALNQAKEALLIEKSVVKRNYNVIGELEESDLSAYIIGSIIMSFTYLESFINEIFHCIKYSYEEKIKEFILEDVSFELRENIIHSWDEFAETLEKYDLLSGLITNKKIQKGKLLYQNVIALKKLRNYFVHYKPEKIDSIRFYNDEVKVNKIGRQLIDKFELNPTAYEGSPLFPDKLLSSNCAFWAINSVLEFTNDYAKKIRWIEYQNKAIDNYQIVAK